jgi:two-component system, sensor histidine kinase PdtaS
MRSTQKLLILLCLVFIYQSVFAQNDEWKKELKKINGNEAQFEWIIGIVKNNKQYVESQQEMLDQAMRLAKEIGTDSAKGKAHLYTGKFYMKYGELKESWTEYQTAKNYFLKGKRFDLASDVLYLQCLLLINQKLPDSVLKFLNSNQKFISQYANEQRKLYWQSLYPIAYDIGEQDDLALKEFQKILPLAYDRKDTQLILSTYMNIAKLQDGFDSSMEWYRKALPVARKGSPPKYVELLYKIGYEYSLRDDALRDSALYYLLEAEKDIDQLTNPVSRMNLENMIGDFFIGNEEYKVALPYLRKAYSYSRNMEGYNMITHNLAICFIQLKQLDSAKYYLELTRQGIEKSQDDYESMLYYHATAQYELTSGDSCSVNVLKNFDRALSYAVKIEETRLAVTIIGSSIPCLLKNSKQSTAINQLASSMLNYCSFFYEPLKKENKLFEYAGFLKEYAALETQYGNKTKALQLYNELTDILFRINREQYTKGLGEAVVKYKSELKDAEIKLLNEREKASATRTILIVVGLIAVLMVAILIFILYQREHKSKQLLDERNHKVEQLLREVHHRVKNNLQIVSSFINIQLNKVTQKEARQALSDTSTRIIALAGLHQSLYRQDNLSRIQLDQYIKDLCHTLESTVDKNIRIDCDLEDLQLNIDQAIPIGLAINELITNALKYAFVDKQEGQINISLQKKDKWQLIVKDNGTGLPEDLHPDHLKSIGIRLVQDITRRQLNGTFSFYNDNGAVFIIEFNTA